MKAVVSSILLLVAATSVAFSTPAASTLPPLNSDQRETLVEIFRFEATESRLLAVVIGQPNNDYLRGRAIAYDAAAGLLESYQVTPPIAPLPAAVVPAAPSVMPSPAMSRPAPVVRVVRR